MIITIIVTDDHYVFNKKEVSFKLSVAPSVFDITGRKRLKIY